MVHKLIYKLLRRCECGGKANLCRYIYTPNEKANGWFVGCQRYTCDRMVTKIYRNPIVAIIKWNIKDWKFSKERFITNGQLKMRILEKLYFKKLKGEN